MPSVSIYVSDEIYQYLASKGKPSAVGKRWIEERYIFEANRAKKIHENASTQVK